MTQRDQIAQALALIAQATNCLLMAQGAAYRVTAADIVITRRRGFTLLALPETRNAADTRHCGRPYSTMENHP